MPSNAVVETAVEVLELLFDGVLVFVAEGLDDLGGGDGTAGGRAVGGTVRVYHIEQRGAWFFPAIHVGARSFLAPSVDFLGSGGV